MAEENVIEVSGRDGITINEYNGKYSLNAVEKGNNEVWYKKWVFLSKWSKEAGGPVADESKRVMSVKIGDSKAGAIETLKQLMNSLTGKTTDESGEIPW